MKLSRRAVIVVFYVVFMRSEAAADVLVAWDVNGVDVEAGSGINGSAPTYEMNATSKGLHIQNGELSLGFDAPSDAANVYGFKFSVATHTSSLGDAIANNHYIQFTLVAEAGYRFDLASIEMNGQSGSSGPDDIALLSSIDGFETGKEIGSLTGRQNITGGWDTDSSGWGSVIDLSDAQYQDLTSATFRIYGWNSTGTASAGIRNLSGDDLVINGTVEAIPEPAVTGFIALTSLGFLVIRRVIER